jgi:hypothetical protein
MTKPANNFSGNFIAKKANKISKIPPNKENPKAKLKLGKLIENFPGIFRKVFSIQLTLCTIKQRSVIHRLSGSIVGIFQIESKEIHLT